MTLAGRALFARCYMLQAKYWSRFVRRLDGAYLGLWLGLLTRRDLEAVDELQYRTSSMYQGEQHNLSGLMPWEEVAIDGFFGGRIRLAVIGAGGGREVLALERRGHQPAGFECSSTLVTFAADFLPRHGAQAKVVWLERYAPPPPAPYEGIIMGWSAYMLIDGRDRRVAMLRDLRALVPDGAPLLLSFFTAPDDMARLSTTYRVASFVRRLLRRSPPELGDDLIPMFVHRFSRTEIEAEMHDAGFHLERFEPQGRGRFDSGWAVGTARLAHT